jgi:hypothetical protein
MPKEPKTRLLITCVVLLGTMALVHGEESFYSGNPLRFAVYFCVAVLSAGMKVHLPSIEGTMSVSFLFALIGVEELSLGEALAMMCSAILCSAAGKRNGVRSWYRSCLMLAISRSRLPAVRMSSIRGCWRRWD